MKLSRSGNAFINSILCCNVSLIEYFVGVPYHAGRAGQIAFGLLMISKTLHESSLLACQAIL